jgi:hypothetical protein
MALTVGTDSYISLEDANTYLNGYHLSTDADMVAWAALSDEHCEILLRRAARLIDRQPLRGVKALTTQSMAFPRAIATLYGSMNLNTYFYGDEWFVQSAVPEEVKQAQCEIALDMTNGVSERVKLQREGVRSFSIGHLSENYVGQTNEVLPIEAKTLLAPYLGGGVSIV